MSQQPLATPLLGAPPSVYAGRCLRCGGEHRLPNDQSLGLSALADLFARVDSDPAYFQARAALAASPGKMIGVLVAESSDGTRHVLQAFSGELDGRTDWPGWAPSVLRREDTAKLEAQTLARIAELDAQLAACDAEAARQRFVAVRAEVTAEASLRRKAARAQRQQWARMGSVDAAQEEALRRAESSATEADLARIEAARQAFDSERRRESDLRAARRDTSNVLADAMFAAAAITNARGERLPLREVFAGEGIPGGTSSCAVPKLLEAANVRGLKPIAIAEAWWGPDLGTRRHGELQPPCERKCLPILGHLLCGMDG